MYIYADKSVLFLRIIFFSYVLKRYSCVNQKFIHNDNIIVKFINYNLCIKVFELKRMVDRMLICFMQLMAVLPVWGK